METSLLREHVKAAAAPKGRIWPNGLGFDYWGWEYMFRDDATWLAVRHRGCSTWVGQGASPEEARLAATRRD